MELSEHILSLMPVSFVQEISDQFLTGVIDPTIETERTIRGMIVKLNAFVTTEHLEPYVVSVPKAVYQEFPLTWWDHFKFTHKNKWWMPFKKIRYTTYTNKVEVKIKVTPAIMFPESTLRLPRMQGLGKGYRTSIWSEVK